MAAGHRWLVFQEADIQVTSTISLDGLAAGTRFLRLEGARVRGTNFRRSNMQPPGTPLLQALNDEWVMDWVGITFVGEAPEGRTENQPVAERCTAAGVPSVQPLVVINHIRDSRFEECAWVANYGIGLHLGATTATRVLLTGCEAGNNCAEGIRIDNVSQSKIVKCVIDRNGLRDIGNIPSLRVYGNMSDPLRGTTAIIDNHFEADSTAHVAIDVDNACAVDIERNYVALADIRLGNDAHKCRAARNRFITAGEPAGEVINTNVDNDVRGSGIERNLVYP